MKKRICSILLVLAMLMSILPATAVSESIASKEEVPTIEAIETSSAVNSKDEEADEKSEFSPAEIAADALMTESVYASFEESLDNEKVNVDPESKQDDSVTDSDTSKKVDAAQDTPDEEKETVDETIQEAVSFTQVVASSDTIVAEALSSNTKLAMVSAAEVQYDELVVGIENPGNVTPGDSLIIRSNVSGGSGDFGYLWTWTHPNGNVMNDPRQNCIIYESVLGTYSFTLTVTDNETGKSSTSGRMTVEVKPAQESYDPISISFVGEEDNVEIELAMVGIAAKCSVSGGSSNFQYAWDIERDGVNLQSYSYGMLKETCTWNADKVGEYTFNVTVKDNETGLTKSASRSVTVIQKEYDPLTLAITTAPKYAEIGETVQVVAETTGGVGDVAVTWDVFNGKNKVASGNGLTAEFVPAEDGKYTVIVYAEDKAQRLEDRVTITAGSLVKCSLSVSSDSVKTGEEVKAEVTVQDGIGPFGYDWMLYLNDKFVSSDLQSDSTSYIWKAEQAGTYVIKCSVCDIGKEELTGELVWATDSVEVVATANEEPISIEKPVVTVTVDGANMSAIWPAVAGANKYVYSIKNITDDKLIANHVTANNRIISVALEVGKSYRLAVGAVPAGVDDLADPDKCSWTEKTFDITADTAIGTPVITANVNGTNMTASWPAVTGASKYVYSLKNITDDKLIANHVDTSSRSISLTLEAGKSYRLAVGAVPAGVDDLINPEKCGWDEKTFDVAAETIIGTPVITVIVNGTNMTASWPAVTGASKYVYSLKNITDDKLIANHIDASSRFISLTLEAGKSYRLAVGAVPAGVDDLVNPEQCRWDEETFTTDSLEELSTAKVLSVTYDNTVVQPGSTITVTVSCNNATAKLDVYKEKPDGSMLDYATLNGTGTTYTYRASFSENGEYQLRFVALNENNDWSRDNAHWGYAKIIVCDHNTKHDQISKSNAMYANSAEHVITFTYRESCVCGLKNREYTEQVLEAHAYNKNDIHVEVKHFDGLGHKEFYVCSVCKGSIETGNYRGYKNNSFSYCSVCVQLKLKNYWKLYNGAIDGLVGGKTIGAANEFRKNCGLDSISALDNETCRLIMTLSSYPAPTSTVAPEVTTAPAVTSAPVDTTTYADTINALDRKDVSDWVNNEELGKDGYLLLEMTLDDNNNGNIFKVGYTAWDEGLKLLQLDVVGIGNDIYGHFNKDKDIQEILLECYVDYINNMEKEMEALQIDEDFRNTMIALSNGKKYEKDIFKFLQSIGKVDSVDGAKMSDLSKVIKSLSSDEAQDLAYELIKAHGFDMDSSDADYAKLVAEFDDWLEHKPQLRLLNTSIDAAHQVGAAVIDVGKFYIDYTESYQEHYAMVNYLANVNSDFLSMLDLYAEEARKSGNKEYYQAIVRFRDDFQKIAQGKINSVVQGYTYNDKGGTLTKKVENLVYDLTLKDIVKDLVVKYGVSKSMLNYVGIGASLVDNLAELTPLAPDKKNEVLDNMIYVRTLKEILASTIENQMDNYDGQSEDDAAVIAASLQFMKTLKYRGEDEALDLLKLITAATEYNAKTDPWRIIITKDGHTYVSTAAVIPTWAVAEQIAKQASADGATVGFVKMKDSGIPLNSSPVLISESGKDSLTRYSDYVKSSGSDLLNINRAATYIKFVPSVTSSSSVYTIQGARDQYNLELQAELDRLEKLKQRDMENPDNYVYWEAFVENYSKKRIEGLDN